MKIEKLGVVTLIATSLVGCDQQTEQEQMESYVRDEAAAQASAALNRDRAELDEAIRIAKAQDPRVVDAYFTFNEKGEKQLNLIREKEDGSGEMENFLMPMLIGMMAGQMLSNMFSSPGYRNDGSYYRKHAKSYYSAPRDAMEKDKKMGGGAYTGAVTKGITNNVYSDAKAGKFTTTTSSGVTKSTSLSSSKTAFGSTGSSGGAKAGGTSFGG